METQQRSRYACDACKRRKVKCVGSNELTPCYQCTHLNLMCHYSNVSPSSRSRKSIKRGAVIKACRQYPSDQRLTLSSWSTFSPARTPEEYLRPTDSPQTQFSATFFRSLVQNYATFVVPSLPVFTETEFVSAIAEMGADQAPSALLLSLAAMTLNMSPPSPAEDKTDQKLKTTLMYQALHRRAPLMPNHQITVRSLAVPFLVANCLFADNHYSDMAFYYLREAITGAEILCVGDDHKAALLTSSDRAQCERLYWVLFIHERYHSISSLRRPTLSGLPILLQHDPAISDGVVNGFNQLIRLFQILDDTFMANWLDKQSATLTQAWIEEKQTQLGGGELDDAWEDEIKYLNEMQQIDLIVTRDWIRHLVWQMALSKLLLTMNRRSDQIFMSILFPARISRRLRLALTDFPLQAVEVHGTGILHKLFDITSTFADILEHVLRATTFEDQAVADYVDDFSFLCRFLDGMSRLYHIEKTVLELRCDTIRELYPSFKG